MTNIVYEIYNYTSSFTLIVANEKSIFLGITKSQEIKPTIK